MTAASCRRSTALPLTIISQETKHLGDFRLRSRRLQLRPLRLRDVANHQEGGVGGWIRRGVPEAANDGFDVLPLTSEKKPARSRIEIVGIFPHHGWSIARGIGRGRDQDDIGAEAITQQSLHVRERLVDNRTGAFAMREEKIDQNHLVFEYIGKEAKLFSVLCNHRKIGEVADGRILYIGLHHRLLRRVATWRRARMVVGDRCDGRKRDEKARNQRYSRHGSFPLSEAGCLARGE